MNTLSWLIYAAEVVGNLQALLIIGAVISGVGVPLAILFMAMAADVGNAPEGSWKRPARFFWLPVVLALLGSLVPSTKAIYMIAASEAGEAVVTSPDAIEMMGDLKAVIKKRLKEELGEAE